MVLNNNVEHAPRGKLIVNGQRAPDKSNLETLVSLKKRIMQKVIYSLLLGLMKGKFLSLTLLMCIANFAVGQNKFTDYDKMLIGKWEYDIAYDTIAVTTYGIEVSENFFFSNMKISKKGIKISDSTEKWSGKWEVKNNNELLIYLDNSKTLKYYITKMEGNILELKSFGAAIPTLGYKKK